MNLDTFYNKTAIFCVGIAQGPKILILKVCQVHSNEIYLVDFLPILKVKMVAGYRSYKESLISDSPNHAPYTYMVHSYFGLLLTRPFSD